MHKVGNVATVSVKRFLRDYSKELSAGSAAVFVGAGLSRGAGFVDWKGLLREVAEDLGLDVDSETDLIALAQYHVNTEGGRGRINQRLVTEFARDAEPNPAIDLLARLPVDSYWTTNYDHLIEDALKAAGRKPDVKVSQRNLATTNPESVATVYKMHGDISAPDQAVLTKDDYEMYDTNRSFFKEKLQGDLVSKTFLFLGFSFTDPNIDAILSRVRVLIGQDARPHYVVMKRPPVSDDTPDSEYDARRFNLRIADLKRYSIHVVLIDSYAQIPLLLQELLRRQRASTFFVSGAASEFLQLGREKVAALAAKLGHRLVSEGYTLVSGFGLGIGGAVVVGGAQALQQSKFRIQTNQLRFRPFPQDVPPGVDRATFHREYRQQMLSDVGVVIVLAGNKLNASEDGVVLSEGVQQEVEIARKNGACIIPIGATGYVAEQLYNQVCQAPASYYPGLDVSSELSVLGAQNSTVSEFVDAVLSIVRKNKASMPESLDNASSH